MSGAVTSTIFARSGGIEAASADPDAIKGDVRTERGEQERGQPDLRRARALASGPHRGSHQPVRRGPDRRGRRTPQRPRTECERLAFVRCPLAGLMLFLARHVVPGHRAFDLSDAPPHRNVWRWMRAQRAISSLPSARRTATAPGSTSPCPRRRRRDRAMVYIRSQSELRKGSSGSRHRGDLPVPRRTSSRTTVGAGAWSDAGE
jgi:hypothetical protein